MIWGPGLPGPQGVAGAQGPQGVPGAAGAPGKVLQVVHSQYDTQVYISGATAYTDTGLSATITPTSTTSQILVLVSQQCYNIGGTTTNAADISAYAGLRLLRNSTAIWEPWQPSNLPVSHGIRVTMATAIINDMYFTSHVPIVYLDSPSTTSALTYKTQGKGHTTGQDSYFQTAGSTSNGKSNIVLMEIAP